MSTRTLMLTAAAVFLLAGASLLAIPGQAEDVAGLNVVVTIDETFPRVTGTVTVTDADGLPVDLATVRVTSAYSTVPVAPAAHSTGATDAAGTFDFGFALASTAAAPGDHTLTVVVQKGDLSETVVVGYNVATA